MREDPDSDALALLRDGRMDDAESLCRARIEAGTDDTGTHHALGRIAMLRGDEHAAEASLRRAVAMDASHDAARYRLAQTVLTVHGTEATAEIYRDWATARPGNAVAAHLRAAADGDAEHRRATTAYVCETFDEMADDFDRVMQALGYCGPILVDAGLARAFGSPGGNLAIVDAGCGTGLCAEVLRPWAGDLHGLDLSPRMAEHALATGLYDRVTCGDALPLLAATKGSIDVVVMADVLIYLGALEDVMATVHAALRPGGAYVFTAERGAASGPDLTLGPAGRFAHHPAYIERAARAAGFRDIMISDVPLRTEGGEPVPCLLGTAMR